MNLKKCEDCIYLCLPTIFDDSTSNVWWECALSEERVGLNDTCDMFKQVNPEDKYQFHVDEVQIIEKENDTEQDIHIEMEVHGVVEQELIDNYPSVQAREYMQKKNEKYFKKILYDALCEIGEKQK